MSPERRLAKSACVGRLIVGAPVELGLAQLNAEITSVGFVVFSVYTRIGPGLSSALKY